MKEQIRAERTAYITPKWYHAPDISPRTPSPAAMLSKVQFLVHALTRPQHRSAENLHLTAGWQHTPNPIPLLASQEMGNQHSFPPEEEKQTMGSRFVAERS